MKYFIFLDPQSQFEPEYCIIRQYFRFTVWIYSRISRNSNGALRSPKLLTVTDDEIGNQTNSSLVSPCLIILFIRIEDKWKHTHRLSTSPLRPSHLGLASILQVDFREPCIRLNSFPATAILMDTWSGWPGDQRKLATGRPTIAPLLNSSYDVNLATRWP